MSDPDTHKNKVRRYILLCCLMFTIDSRCSSPLHTLMTDVVDSLGGTANLVKILNRLGVCASEDTLPRFIQHKVSTQQSTAAIADTET